MKLIPYQLFLTTIFLAHLITGQTTRVRTAKSRIKGIKTDLNIEQVGQMKRQKRLGRATKQRISDSDNGCPLVRGSSCRGVTVCRSGPGTRKTMCLEGSDDMENGDECGPCPPVVDECKLFIDLDISITEPLGHEVQPCLQAPTASTMLYNGGSCSQSDPYTYSNFVCEDQNGGPPSEVGSVSYIIVTDVDRENFNYFEGFVKVGDSFHLDGGGKEYDADLVITIYGPGGITDASGILQKVQFSNDCKFPVELGRRFGASQLVEMTNDLQGSISLFQTIEKGPVSLTVSISSQNQVTLESLKILTTFNGYLDLSEQVEGLESTPEQPVNVLLPEFFSNSTEPTRYSMLIDANGLFGDLKCHGIDFLQFVY